MNCIYSENSVDSILLISNTKLKKKKKKQVNGNFWGLTLRRPDALLPKQVSQ